MLFQSQNTISHIIVGLGNPGRKYEKTRHNVGFEAIDALAKELGVSVTQSKFDALVGTATLGGDKVLLMKPQTFMNASGIAVRKASDFYKIPAENIIVLFDDISLAPGRLRLRKSGSAGGHNGIKSIIAHVGSEFPRIKIGVGEKPHPDYDLADWVLGKFTDADRKAVDARYAQMGDAITMIMKGQFDAAMSQYNG